MRTLPSLFHTAQGQHHPKDVKVFEKKVILEILMF
jgi:hypothetical protein